MWLSRDHVISILFPPSAKRNQNFHDGKGKYYTTVIWQKWLISLAFNVDEATYLNELNIRLQENGKLRGVNDIRVFSDFAYFEALLTTKNS